MSVPYKSPFNEQALVEQQHTRGDYLLKCPVCHRELYHSHEVIWDYDSGIGLCHDCHHYKRRVNGY